jgi:hypothetical protein
VNHLAKRSMLVAVVASLPLLFSSTLIAQDNLPGPTAAAESFSTLPAFRPASEKISSARWDLTSLPNPLVPVSLASNTAGGYYFKVSALDRETATAVANYAALRLPPSPFQVSSTNPSSIRVPASLPSSMPQASGSDTSRASGSNAPKQPNWARRHALLLSGLALTGAGGALVATGGDTQASGCLAAGPYGEVQCTTVPTWGSGRHIGGVLLLSAGVTLAIWGLFKHD